MISRPLMTLPKDNMPAIQPFKETNVLSKSFRVTGSKIKLA
jgi:hypothetical protein